MKAQFFRSLVLVVLSVSTISILATTGNAQGKGDKTLVGAWEMIITFRDCTTGAATRQAPGLISFMFGGVMQEYGLGQQIPQNRTDAQGNWSHDMARNYSAVAKAFRFNIGGSYAGSAKLYRLVELSQDGEAFEASVASEIYDASGVLISRGCATESGRRLE